MAQVRLCLPGRASASPSRTGVGRVTELDHATLKVYTELRPESRSSGGHDELLIEADENDVVQLQWESGIIELVRVGDLPAEWGATKRGSVGEVGIPRRRALRDAVRGDSSLDLESVQHFVVDNALDKALGVAADFVMPPAIRAIEEKFIDAPGLYTIDVKGKRQRRVTRDNLSGEGPYLVLIHGTLSHGAAAFGDLFSSDHWPKLFRSYAATDLPIMRSSSCWRCQTRRGYTCSVTLAAASWAICCAAKRGPKRRSSAVSKASAIAKCVET
jgi:hypothetical protein